MFNIISPKILISIVSHGQIDLIYDLLNDLKIEKIKNYKIILTINIHENIDELYKYSDLPILIIKNNKPKGFGDNHNQAFNKSTCDLFIILNPDIRLNKLNIENILKIFKENDIGAIGPKVICSTGLIEDSARYFPTIYGLIKRAIFRIKKCDYIFSDRPIEVDWVAGMFVVYRADAFRFVNGFDTKYFMYYEDADICWRLKMAGWRTILQPNSVVIHNAQRMSHRNIKYFIWHICSLFRILFFKVRKKF